MLKNMSVFIGLLIITLSCSSDNGVSGSTDSVIRIGVIREAGGNFALQRLSVLSQNDSLLNSVGISELVYKQIASDINPDSLSQYDIIYLAEDWAITSSNVYENILANKDKFLDYLNKGGALYSDQPNAYDRQPNGDITIEFLPVPFTVKATYRNENISIVDPAHYITMGLDSTEMPLTGDQVVNLPDAYTVLAKGSTTGYPALFVQEYGKGKILFSMGSASFLAIHPFSNEAYVRMLSWLVK
jgi:hypothetical protein